MCLNSNRLIWLEIGRESKDWRKNRFPFHLCILIIHKNDIEKAQIQTQSMDDDDNGPIVMSLKHYNNKYDDKDVNIIKIMMII